MMTTFSSLLRRAPLALILIALLAVVASAPVATAVPQEEPQVGPVNSWPQEVTIDEGTIVLYQPQPEALDGNVLTGRSAFSLELTGREPIFGALWFSARLEPGSDSDSITVHSASITRVTWPDSTDDGEARFTEIIEDRAGSAGMEISRAQLAASLATAEGEKRSLDMIRNEAPEILFRENLAVLLLYDGEPRFSPVENSSYERALNTPFAVARDTDDGMLYLSSGTLWYAASDPLGPWAPTAAPPADLAAMMPAPESDAPAPSTAPEIVVATQPTELISTDGRANWQSLSGGDLLYVANTETPWLRLVSANEMFILLSGRWFKSSSQSGPWEFVRGDQLPTSFSEIPPDSDIGGVRTSVAGTEEADQATLEGQLPQVTAIKRDEASLTVEYDGAPKFEAIEGTSVAYAVNTGAQVLQIEGRYYAVDNGVWFTSGAATGPWVVADSVPSDEISKIPPSSPVYNTTYVQVYDSTPQVVYVGYTPGYMWSFPYYGVPIYGTGYYYPPYWGGGAYYPRAPTWGFHVGYNPWTGWNFGVSWSNGFFSFGVSWGSGWGGGYHPGRCCGGWYGGGYHRGPTYINTGDINIGNSVNVGNRASVENRMRESGRADDLRSNRSLYDQPTNRARNADRATLDRPTQLARPTTGRENNVFADRNGNVARRDGNSWQTREGGAWKPSTGTAGAGNRPSATTRPRLDSRDLNRHLSARQSGARSQASRAPARRSGGGRRRR